MKKFIVKLKSDNSVLGIFDTKIDASKFIVKSFNNNLIDTIFDIICEEKDAEYPLTFSDACKFLGITEGTIALKGDNGIAKSAVAFYKLSIIAKAWNKIDGFVPDFSNDKQLKYFPWFLIGPNMRASCVRIRATRLRVRVRLSVLGFASNRPRQLKNSERHSRPCTMKCSFR